MPLWREVAGLRLVRTPGSSLRDTVAVGPIEPIACEGSHLAAVDGQDRAEAVVLDLVNPRLALRWLGAALAGRMRENSGHDYATVTWNSRIIVSYTKVAARFIVPWRSFI